jgi:hypothetical protein
MYKQAVVRLCQGAADKEAGSYASNIRPKNIEEAIDKMRWFQHNNQAIITCKTVETAKNGWHPAKNDIVEESYHTPILC